MTQLIVRNFEERDELTPEQLEEAIRAEWEELQTVPAYVERMNAKTGNPILFDVEYSGK